MRAVPVEIPLSAGLVLRGERYGEPGERWAILAHEEGRDLDAWRDLARTLVELGCCVLAFDLAGHGTSDDPFEPRRLPGDVLAVMRLAESEGAEWLALVGAGAGATAALAAAGRREVDAIVALSPLAGLDGLPREAIRETVAPKLIFVGSEDREAAAEAEEVHRSTIGWGVLQSFPTTIQGTALLDSEWAEHVVENTVAFLRDYGAGETGFPPRAPS
jgi:alpha-beta hydrolase superfamily lysophospholipase